MIAHPTRITSNTASLLELIATNRSNKVKEIDVIYLGIRDHNLVYVRLKVSVPRDKPKIVESGNLKNYNINHFNSHISHSLRNSSWDHKDPTHLWVQFKDIFNYVSDLYAPVKTRKVRITYAPWLTSKIRWDEQARSFEKESC